MPSVHDHARENETSRSTRARASSQDAGEPLERPRMTNGSTKRRITDFIPAPVCVFVGAFLVQFFVLNMIAASRHFLPDGDDMKFYNDWAQRISDGQFTDGKAFYGLPGYAFALAGIYKTTGGYNHFYSPYLVGQLQAAMHALTATWLFLLGRRIFGGESAEDRRRGTGIGLLAAIGWVAFTPAQVFSAILMPTAWVVCAFWGTTYWLVCIHARGPATWWRPWLWIGLLAGAVAMMVATILMLLPLVVVAIALTVRRGCAPRARILPAAAAVMVLMAGVYAGCSPVWIHNYFVAKDRVLLSAHDGLNFYLGNHATSNGYTKIPAGLRASQEGLLKDSLTIPEKVLGRALKRSEVSAYWKEKGKAFIRGQPLAWMRLLGRKFANFWNSYQYDDLSILKLLRDEGAVPAGLRFGFAAAIGLPGLLFCWHRWPRSRWVAGATLLHMAALMPVFVTERYRLAAAPGLLLLGAGGLWWLWENIAGRRWIAVGVQCAALAGSVWFATRPQEDIGLWSLDFYKAGLRAREGAVEAEARERAALAKGDTAEAARQHSLIPPYLDHAQRSLETSFAYVPLNDEIAFALGNVWMDRRDQGRARDCYLLAVRIARATGREHSGTLNNLGVIAIERKDWPAAAHFLRASLAAEPDDAAKTWFLLATVLRQLPDLPGARAAIAKAIALKPGRTDFEQLRAALETPVPPAP